MEKRSKALNEFDSKPSLEKCGEKSGHCSGAMLKASLIAPRDIIDGLPEEVLKWLHDEKDDCKPSSLREVEGRWSDFESVIVDRLFPLRDARPFIRRLHVHSLATATAAASLAEKKAHSAKTAWVCGWLHDLGIAACLKHADEVTRLADDQEFESVWPSIERSSAQHAIRLASRWRLPSAVRYAIREHEGFVTLRSPSPVAAITNVAEHIATLIGFGFQSGHSKLTCLERALDLLGIGEAEIFPIATRTERVVRHLTSGSCAGRFTSKGA